MSADLTLSRRSLLRSIVSARRVSTTPSAPPASPGTDDVDVEAREHVAPRVERLRQRLAAAHVVADLLQHRGDGRRRGEADQELERAVERQAGVAAASRARA